MSGGYEKGMFESICGWERGGVLVKNKFHKIWMYNKHPAPNGIISAWKYTWQLLFSKRRMKLEFPVFTALVNLIEVDLSKSVLPVWKANSTCQVGCSRVFACALNRCEQPTRHQLWLLGRPRSRSGQARLSGLYMGSLKSNFNAGRGHSSHESLHTDCSPLDRSSCLYKSLAWLDQGSNHQPPRLTVDALTITLTSL